jgi:hypothetical protein
VKICQCSQSAGKTGVAGILRDFTPGSFFEEMIKSELHGDMQELSAMHNSLNA